MLDEETISLVKKYIEINIKRKEIQKEEDQLKDLIEKTLDANGLKTIKFDDNYYEWKVGYSPVPAVETVDESIIDELYELGFDTEDFMTLRLDEEKIVELLKLEAIPLSLVQKHKKTIRKGYRRFNPTMKELK